MSVPRSAVVQAYRTHLGREPSEAEIAFQAANAPSVDALNRNIQLSPEWTRRAVTIAFGEHLGRAPSPDEPAFNSFQGMTLDQIRAAVRGSQEYRDLQFQKQAGVTQTPLPQQATPTPTPPPGPTPEQRDAQGIIEDVLKRYGLETLTPWAWQQITQGTTPAQVKNDLYNTPEFKARFPVIFERQAKGLPAVSPEMVVRYEDTVRQLGSRYGIPQQFLTRDYIQSQMAADKSPAEIDERFRLNQMAVYEAAPEVRAELRRLFNVHEGDLTAFFLDEKQAAPILQQKVAAAQVGAAALRTGYGALTGQEALGLAQQGVAPAEAQRGFSQLAGSQQLFSPLNAGETPITREQQLGAEFGGNAEAQQAIKQRARQRLAEFEAGAKFAQDRSGITGMGTATSP